MAKYADYSYQEILELGLNKRFVIESPSGYEQFNFAMEIKDNDDGGLELSVFYHDLPPYGEVPPWIKEAGGIDDITQGESSFRAWFDIYKDD